MSNAMLAKIKGFINSLRNNRYMMTVFAYLAGELPSVSCFKLSSPSSKLYEIAWSKRVHLTSIDGRVGKSHYKHLNKFIYSNPECIFVIWSEEMQKLFMAEKFSGTRIYNVFNDTPFGIVRSDIFRLCVLSYYGGYYFDLKSSFAAKLNALFPEDCKLALIQESLCPQGEESGALSIANWFLYAAPRHQFIQRCIDNISDSYIGPQIWPRKSIAEFVWSFSGPRLLSRTACSYLNASDNSPDVLLISPDGKTVGAVYACKGSWVRKTFFRHYTTL